ncbi:MAG: regulatory protein RecX [Hespellia sp.]|nr:regulatory protein RecX [Hespellia sp.]
MIVTKIEQITKTKYRIELDGEFAFVLYKGELSRFCIQENEEMEAQTFQTIKTEILLKRAKLRAMHLLNDMDRTEAGLREKLRQNLYPGDVIDQAIEYVKSFGYINDYRYASHFIESRRRSKSRREIQAMLTQRGISKDVLEVALEEAYAEDGDQTAILAILQKKRFEKALGRPEEMRKIYAYLARKGFRYEEVRRVIQEYSEDREWMEGEE